MKLTDFDILFVDLDGVVWFEGKPIKENIEALNIAKKSGVRIVIVTNNSTRSRRTYRFVLSKIGLDLDERDIITSSYVLSEYIYRKTGVSPVLPIGEAGLIEELSLKGHIVLTRTEWEYAKYVAVGLDRKLSYEDLSAAARSIMNGAVLVVANRDELLPTPQGPAVGAGGIASLLERITEVRDSITIGKPSRILSEILKTISKDAKAVFIGDKISTDMAQAKIMGIPGILVCNKYREIKPSNTSFYSDIHPVKFLSELL